MEVIWGLASFNSRLREEATDVPQDVGEEEHVSTHASVRRRQLPAINTAESASFNSRLREEATFAEECDQGQEEVSTHASVRRRPEAGAADLSGG